MNAMLVKRMGGRKHVSATHSRWLRLSRNLLNATSIEQVRLGTGEGNGATRPVKRDEI